MDERFSRRTILAAGATVAIAPLPALGSLGGPGTPQGKKMDPKLVRVPTEADIAKALNTASKGISEATHKAHLTLWQGYANKTNEIRQKLAAVDFDPAKANQIYSEIRALKVNYAFALGGYKNHNVYFGTIGGNGGNGGPATGAIADEITKSFGSFADFAKQWKAVGVSSRGWAYLGWSRDEGMLEILAGDSQDTFPAWNHDLVLALDVYEHAYFLDFQTKRPAYIDAYMNCIDWDASNALLAKAKG